MARPTTVLVIFFLSMNLFAGALMGMGIDEDLGISPETIESGAQDDLLDHAGQNGEGLPTGTGGVGEALSSMFVVIGSWTSGLFGFLFPALDLLHQVGVPGAITYGILSPLFTVIIAIELAAFIRGFEL